MKMNILLVFNFLGLIAFMFSGALVAIKNKMDLGGVIFLSAITGVGGGTIRDLLLQLPVFWMQDNWYLYLAIGISLIVFFFYHAIDNAKKLQFEKILNIFDTLGTASFMIATTSIAQFHHQSILLTVTLCVITCIGGTVIRDLICGEIPLAFKKELHATSVVLSSMIFLTIAHTNTSWAIIISCLFLISMRIITIHYDLHLPRKLLE
jgi:uncharacterized membrane protein YeiH